MMDSNAAKQLGSCTLFAGFNEQELVDLAKLAKPKFYEGRTVIIGMNEEKHPLYVIMDGKVQVRLEEQDESSGAVLAQYNTGEHFGEVQLMSPQPSPVVVETIQATHCAAFDVGLLKEYLFSSPDIAIKFLWNIGASLAERLRDTDRRVGLIVKSRKP